MKAAADDNDWHAGPANPLLHTQVPLELQLTWLSVDIGVGQWMQQSPAQTHHHER